MKQIDLKEIIKLHGLKEKVLAGQLFPNNNYPHLALKRVITGGGFLDSAQVAKLAEVTGEDISDLYTQKGWKTKPEKGLLRITKPGYTVTYNSKTLRVIIYFERLDQAKEYIIEPDLEVSKLINLINTNIKEYEANGN